VNPDGENLFPAHSVKLSFRFFPGIRHFAFHKSEDENEKITHEKS
jgi:hypothetical protein